MDLSTYLRECERLRHDIAKEKDRALRREMEKTYKYLHKQARAASTHHHPWHGLRSAVVFLAVIFLVIVFTLVYLQKAYGWGYTTTGLIATAAFLVVALGTILVVKKVISSDQYVTLVQSATNMFNGLSGKKSDEDAEPQALPSSTSSNERQGTNGNSFPSLPSVPLQIEADSDSKAKGG